jgi:hypothetical protein
MEEQRTEERWAEEHYLPMSGLNWLVAAATFGAQVGPMFAATGILPILETPEERKATGQDQSPIRA